MKTKSVSMVAMAIAMGLALPVAAMAQDAGSGPAVQSPMQLPGTSGAPQAQVPQPQEDPGVNWKGVGIGAGTVVGNALYMPAKLVYGILGGLAGGAGWALTGGNTQVSNTIWRSSLGGDYVLTPNMVAGKEPIHFSGPTTTAVPPPPLDPSANAGGSSTMTASSAALATVPAATAVGPHPIDRGAGPIGGASPRGGASGLAGPLPSTSIE
ncbi:MAG: hypothetical protein IVW56_10730 [Candidatus Binataceae bacterium]|nr:hypothetical protein [Candidatus Binataceae bacterium]